MLGDVFSHFANAVLERSLPSILGWLRNRFGEDVLLESVTVDGSSIRLEDVRIPIGSRAALVARSATFVANEQVVAGGIPLRLAHLEGEIVVAGETLDEPARFVMPLKLSGERDAKGAWISGRVEVRGARWLASIGEHVAALDGSLRVRITEDRWSITDGRANAGSARIAFFGEGRLDGAALELRLTAVDARATHFLDALAALLGASLRLPFVLPPDAMVDAELHITKEDVRGRLAVRTATSNLALEPFVGSLADRSLQGSHLTGTLSVADAGMLGLFGASAWVPSEGHVRIDAEISGPAARPRLDGRVATDALHVRLASRPDLAPLVLRQADGALAIDREGLALRGLSGSLFGGRLALDLALSFAEPGMDARIQLTDARDALRPFLEGLLRCPLPGRLRLDVDLASDAARVLRGSVRLSKPKSEIAIDLVLDPALSLEGTTLSGGVAFGDLYDLSRQRNLLVTGRGRLAFDGSLEGTLRSPGVLLSLRTEDSKLLIARGTAAWVIPLERAAARIHANRERFLLSELRVQAFGGRIVAKGLHAPEPDAVIGDPKASAPPQKGFRGTQAKIEVSDLAVGALPLLPGGTVSDALEGRLRGVLTLSRREGRLTAKGHVTIDDAQYRAIVRALRTPLARFGLKPPGARGVGPLEADLVVNERGLTLKDLRVAVQGGTLRGDLLLAAGGSLAGALEARLEGGYLRTSSLLRVPASVVSDVSIPVRVRGTLTSPTFQADGAAALDRLISRVDLGRGLQHAVDSLIREVLAPRSEATTRPGADKARTGLSDQAIFERIVDGVSHRTEDKLVDVLLDRGLSPDEIATGIEEVRERRR